MSHLKLTALITAALPVLLILATSLLAGCNTTAGFGEDVQAAGSALERNAEKRSY